MESFCGAPPRPDAVFEAGRAAAEAWVLGKAAWKSAPAGKKPFSPDFPQKIGLGPHFPGPAKTPAALKFEGNGLRGDPLPRNSRELGSAVTPKLLEQSTADSKDLGLELWAV